MLEIIGTDKWLIFKNLVKFITLYENRSQIHFYRLLSSMVIEDFYFY